MTVDFQKLCILYLTVTCTVPYFTQNTNWKFLLSGNKFQQRYVLESFTSENTSVLCTLYIYSMYSWLSTHCQPNRKGSRYKFYIPY